MSVFFPYYSITYVYPPPPAPPINSYTKPYFGYIELIYGGWPGLILIVISLIILNPERKGKSLLVGGVGCVLIIINLMIRPSIQSITINLGFYIGFIFCIGFFVINVFAFISKEGIISLKRIKEGKMEPKTKIKKVKIKKEEEADVGIDWEKRELAKKQAIDYIKKMHLKSRELPFYKIISKIGIDRNDLEKIVGEMITNKEINAKVTDFVIIFKKISEEKREEELNKNKRELQQKMSEIDNLINESRFNLAAKNLKGVIEFAKINELKDFISKAEEKIAQCRELESEKLKEEELNKIKREFQQKMSEIDDLIKKSRFNLAVKNLKGVIEFAKNNELKDFISKAEEKIAQCRELESEKLKEEELNKIKREFQQKMSEIDDLIKKSRFNLAVKNLKGVIEFAKNNELKDFISKAEEKLTQCKELEKRRVKESLQMKISEINSLIQEKKIKVALKNLDKVKATAKGYNLSEILNEAEEITNQCKELEAKTKKDKEQVKIKNKLQKKLSNIEKLIDGNKLSEALENLVEIEEIAEKNEQIDLLENIEDKIEYCRNFQFNTVNKVKNTILNYGSKLTRLEIMDISEKSGIQDEKLIEQIILEMIDNREIKAEYFSSSKSIAFYQPEKDVEPTISQIVIKNLRVFLSYSSLDVEHFKISDIVKNLEIYPEIKKASYWQADSKQNIVEFMEETLKSTDVFVLFCSKNSVKSNAVKDEWQAAFQMRKRGMLKIIPIYEDEDDIPVLLWQLLNVKFEKDNFKGFIEKLYKEILR